MDVKRICIMWFFFFVFSFGIPPKEPGMTTVKKKPSPPAKQNGSGVKKTTQSYPTSPTSQIVREYRPRGTKGGIMVYVPAGDFTMGCDISIDKNCDSNSNPKHLVYLNAFYIDKYEVTQEEYDECVNVGSCRPNEKYSGFSEIRHPVVGVTWEDAKKYCDWAGKKLPTEAEWEKAARGSDGRQYPWGNEINSSKSNYAVSGINVTKIVGIYPSGASPYGAMDMAGNAWEWVSDFYDEKYYANRPGSNPQGPPNGKNRSLRGGSWYSYAVSLQTFNRGHNNPTYYDYTIGFRCAKGKD